MKSRLTTDQEKPAPPPPEGAKKPISPPREHFKDQVPPKQPAR